MASVNRYVPNVLQSRRVERHSVVKSRVKKESLIFNSLFLDFLNGAFLSANILGTFKA